SGWGWLSSGYSFGAGQDAGRACIAGPGRDLDDLRDAGRAVDAVPLFGELEPAVGQHRGGADAAAGHDVAVPHDLAVGGIDDPVLVHDPDQPTGEHAITRELGRNQVPLLVVVPDYRACAPLCRPEVATVVVGRRAVIGCSTRHLSPTGPGRARRGSRTPLDRAS